jgi:2-oxo-4-hydroxy-4-carboxy-5-ureidoimidazoline decarboxylase
MTLADLNTLGRGAFVDAVGWVFEDSPWVAERAWHERPFRSIDHLHASMVEQLMSAAQQEQLALLRAHPDLGSRESMTPASSAEQAGAGLDSLTRDELARLQALNIAYRTTFGFPFLYAVKGSTKHDILRALEQRTTAGQEEELQQALLEVSRIARFRLEDTLS